MRTRDGRPRESIGADAHDWPELRPFTRVPKPEPVPPARDSAVSCLLLATVDTHTVAQVLGTLSPTLQRQLDACLKAGLGLS